MKARKPVASGIAAIDKAGILLVFPIGNRKEPASLWFHFHPRSEMKWEWDDDGDNRVANLWHLRSELSTTRKVVYTKWYQGRATYFSRGIFAAMLRAMNPSGSPKEDPTAGLSKEARRVLEILDHESPLSTKELKRMADLCGRANERVYQKALSELWSRLLIVAFGEVADGAFPSLAVGSTRILFEDLWSEAFSRLSRKEAEARIERALPERSAFRKHYAKLLRAAEELPTGSASGRTSPGKKKKPRLGPASVIRFEDLQ